MIWKAIVIAKGLGQMETFKLGDIVDIPVHNIYGVKVIGIMPQNSDYNFGIIFVTYDMETYGLARLFMIDYGIINIWRERVAKFPACVCVDNLESYIGKVGCGFIADFVVRQMNPGKGQIPYPRICAKCGQFDEYAAPSDKHNNEVRCYKCY